MTTVKIDLPDQQAEALKAKLAAQGLTLEGWFQKMAAQEAPTGKPHYSLSELIAQCDPDAARSCFDVERTASHVDQRLRLARRRVDPPDGVVRPPGNHPREH